MANPVARLRKLVRHFSTSTALPAFAIVKSIELFILQGRVPPQMLLATVALTAGWCAASWIDMALEEASEAVDEATDAVQDATDG